MPTNDDQVQRKAKVTDEHRGEAKLLKKLWDAKADRPTQAVFGETYEIGNQSAVGQFLRGEAALSLKAARGFAKGLGCEIADFSPRLAADAAVIASSVPAGQLSPPVERLAKQIDAFPDRQKRELVRLVNKLIRAEQNAPAPPPRPGTIPRAGEERSHTRRHSAR